MDPQKIRHLFPEVNQTVHGYFQIVNPPSEQEISDYYSKKYFQESKGAYQSGYSEEELVFTKNKIEQKYKVISRLRGKQLSYGDLLDIGCGEGWAMNYFQEQGWDVTGIDYSDFGMRKFNPHLIRGLMTGDIYNILDNIIAKERSYDVLWLTNVLEHVLDPVKLIEKLKKLTRKEGVLVITVPNDFSDLQLWLMDRGIISSPFWIVRPDHISYFNRDSLIRLMRWADWKVSKVLSDFPIDINLMNSKTNYISDKTIGKEVHKARIEIENFLHSKGVYKVNEFYSLMAELGLGRQITGFFTRKDNNSKK